jgi:hypothetical protein
VADVQKQHHICTNQRLSVGHFEYWHVSPIVSEGQRVRAGQRIGWTCLGEWHVHLSEWASLGGTRVWVNPLHRGGKIAPYTDTAPPIVSRLRFFSPPAESWQPQRSLSAPDSARRLVPARLHGLVELRAEIGDRQSFWGFITHHPAWQTLHHPYRIAVVIQSRRTGTAVLRRVAFQSDQLPQTPYLVHYAPGTVEDGSLHDCRRSRRHCSGRYWFRPFSRFRQEFWDTTTVANGVYVVTVSAWDIEGNKGSSSVVVSVANTVRVECSPRRRRRHEPELAKPQRGHRGAQTGRCSPSPH